jgi:multidrug efflux pump subunit AcrA (membrane-fusion protein)
MSIFSLILRYGSIAAAIFGVMAIIFIHQTQAEKQMPAPGNPPIMPPQKPFVESVAATGILESLSENVAIGVPIPGLVAEVPVKVNDKVKPNRKFPRPRSRSAKRNSPSCDPNLSASLR